jgi:hypothetical protein
MIRAGPVCGGGLTGLDETLENAYLMRLAGRFSRRISGYAKAQNIPVIDCSTAENLGLQNDIPRQTVTLRLTASIFCHSPTISRMSSKEVAFGRYGSRYRVARRQAPAIGSLIPPSTGEAARYDLAPQPRRPREKPWALPTAAREEPVGGEHVDP